MKELRIRSDLIRVARAFTVGATGAFVKEKIQQRDILKSVYVEPHKCGVGVQIVSSDGAAMCVQWDTQGHVDRPYLVRGLKGNQMPDMSGANINERWLCHDGKDTYVQKGDTEIVLEGVKFDPATTDGEDDTPGIARFPQWRALVPTREKFDAMIEGYPGVLNAAILSTIGRLYEDGMINAREAVIRHEQRRDGNIVMQFPWREGMFVVIAPFIDSPSSDIDWQDRFTAVIDGEADPAADL